MFASGFSCGWRVIAGRHVLPGDWPSRRRAVRAAIEFVDRTTDAPPLLAPPPTPAPSGAEATCDNCGGPTYGEHLEADLAVRDQPVRVCRACAPSVLSRHGDLPWRAVGAPG